MAEPQTRPGLDASQKLQVVVGNCFQKAVELILHARIMPLTPELNRGASNEWVRLRMRAARSRDLPARALANVFSPAAVLARPQFDVRSEELLRVHDELEAWRRDISQPLQLDIFVDATDEPMMRGALGMHAEEPTRVLLERWRLHYDPHDAPATQIALKPIYKRFMVLLRALLAQLRLLPTYRLASSLAKLRGSHAGSLLQYAITLPRSEAGIAAARSRGFAAGAKQYSFPSPDTKEKHGKLEIELLYRPETLFAGRTPTPSCAVFCDAAAIATAATGRCGRTRLRAATSALAWAAPHARPGLRPQRAAGGSVDGWVNAADLRASSAGPRSGTLSVAAAAAAANTGAAATAITALAGGRCGLGRGGRPRALTTRAHDGTILRGRAAPVPASGSRTLAFGRRELCGRGACRRFGHAACDSDELGPAHCAICVSATRAWPRQCRRAAFSWGCGVVREYASARRYHRRCLRCP